MRPTLAIALLTLTLASCAAQRTPDRLGGGGRLDLEVSDPDLCRPQGISRPFGRRFTAFGETMADRWQRTKDDIPKRVDVLGSDWERAAERRALEFEQTMGLIEYAPRAAYIDASLHSESLGTHISGYFKRAKRDASCFFSRAWYDLKVLE